MYLTAVQYKLDLRDYRSRQVFRDRIFSLMERAVGEGQGLVAFPEDIGTPLAFTDAYELVKDESNLAKAVERVVGRRPMAHLFQRLRYRVGWARALALVHAKTMGSIYLDVFSQAAREFGTTVVAGSTCLPQGREGGVYNITYSFGPDGSRLGVQRKVNLIELESQAGLDLTPGDLDGLEVFSSPVGKVGVAICYDGFQGPVIERLVQLNAEILIQPSANPGPWSPEQQEDWLKGIWAAFSREETLRWGINPMMVGHLFDLEFQGQSSILGRKDGSLGYLDTQPRPFFISVAASATQEEILVVHE